MILRCYKREVEETPPNGDQLVSGFGKSDASVILNFNSNDVKLRNRFLSSRQIISLKKHRVMCRARLRSGFDPIAEHAVHVSEV